VFFWFPSCFFWIEELFSILVHCARKYRGHQVSNSGWSILVSILYMSLWSPANPCCCSYSIYNSVWLHCHAYVCSSILLQIRCSIVSHCRSSISSDVVRVVHNHLNKKENEKKEKGTSQFFNKKKQHPNNSS
jgi:hypothetical protein